VLKHQPKWFKVLVVFIFHQVIHVQQDMRGLYVVEEQMVFVLVIWVIQVLKVLMGHKVI
jgi:hypothetical protein